MVKPLLRLTALQDSCLSPQAFIHMSLPEVHIIASDILTQCTSDRSCEGAGSDAVAATASHSVERLHCSSMWAAPSISARASWAQDVVALQTARATTEQHPNVGSSPLASLLPTLLLQTPLCCRWGIGQSRRVGHACQVRGLAQRLLTCLWGLQVG